MKMFNLLEFKEIYPAHFHAKHQFGRYELSVILEPHKTRYEIAIFEDNKFVQLPGIHSEYDVGYSGDVICGLLPETVDLLMLKLELLGTKHT